MINVAIDTMCNVHYMGSGEKIGNDTIMFIQTGENRFTKIQLVNVDRAEYEAGVNSKTEREEKEEGSNVTFAWQKRGKTSNKDITK